MTSEKPDNLPQNSPLNQNLQERFITYRELRPLGIKFSRVWLAIKERDGEFPRRVRIGSRTVAWSLREIQDWMEQCKSARPQSPTNVQ